MKSINHDQVELYNRNVWSSCGNRVHKLDPKLRRSGVARELSTTGMGRGGKDAGGLKPYSPVWVSAQWWSLGWCLGSEQPHSMESDLPTRGGE